MLARPEPSVHLGSGKTPCWQPAQGQQRLWRPAGCPLSCRLWSSAPQIQVWGWLNIPLPCPRLQRTQADWDSRGPRTHTGPSHCTAPPWGQPLPHKTPRRKTDSQNFACTVRDTGQGHRRVADSCKHTPHVASALPGLRGSPQGGLEHRPCPLCVCCFLPAWD